MYNSSFNSPPTMSSYSNSFFVNNYFSFTLHSNSHFDPLKGDMILCCVCKRKREKLWIMYPFCGEDVEKETSWEKDSFLLRAFLFCIQVLSLYFFFLYYLKYSLKLCVLLQFRLLWISLCSSFSHSLTHHLPQQYISGEKIKICFIFST